MRLQDFPQNFIEHFLKTNAFADVDSNGVTRAEYIAELERRKQPPAEKPKPVLNDARGPQFTDPYGW